MAPLLNLAILALPLLLERVQAFATPEIPLGWATIAACAVDDAARVIASDVTTQSDTNTPAACVQSCAAAGFGYAGVEFGDECHCGTGLDESLVDAGPDACNVPCTGDATLSCGGSWAIQIYTVAALRPGTWAYQGCTLDTAASPAFADAAPQAPFPTDLDATNQCLQACAHDGFAFAGVEDGGACSCSAGGPGADAQIAPEAECDSLCPLPGNAGFEFCGGVERMGVFKFVG